MSRWAQETLWVIPEPNRIPKRWRARESSPTLFRGARESPRGLEAQDKLFRKISSRTVRRSFITKELRVGHSRLFRKPGRAGFDVRNKNLTRHRKHELSHRDQQWPGSGQNPPREQPGPLPLPSLRNPDLFPKESTNSGIGVSPLRWKLWAGRPSYVARASRPSSSPSFQGEIRMSESPSTGPDAANGEPSRRSPKPAHRVKGEVCRRHFWGKMQQPNAELRLF